jgi:hypothetical protein
MFDILQYYIFQALEINNKIKSATLDSQLCKLPMVEDPSN